MIKHIVMWNLAGDSDAERARVAAEVKARFESLIGRVPGLLQLEIGVDISKVSYACDVVLYSEFQDQASLAAYAEHPAHLEVRDALKDMRIARYQVDYAPDRSIAAKPLQPWSESIVSRK